MNKLLPRTNVNWGAAIWAGSSPPSLLELTKFAFVASP